jgi:hypothetical protein
LLGCFVVCRGAITLYPSVMWQEDVRTSSIFSLSRLAIWDSF